MHCPGAIPYSACTRCRTRCGVPRGTEETTQSNQNNPGTRPTEAAGRIPADPTRSAFFSSVRAATIADCPDRPMELLLISLASLAAGFVDSIVGGGGLILLPALFALSFLDGWLVLPVAGIVAAHTSTSRPPSLDGGQRDPQRSRVSC